MKKTILLLACLLCTLTASAQRARSTNTRTFFSTESTNRPITFGIRAGLNFASLNMEHFHNEFDGRTSFHVGFSVDLPILQSLYVQSGLFLSSKGASYEDDSYDYKETISPLYLEIPVLASYRYDFSEAVQFQFNIGPYFAYGISGTWTEEEKGYKHEYDIFDDGKEESDLKRFDTGLQLGIGFTLNNHFCLNAAYQIGFSNILGDSWPNYSMKNRNFMISLGYNF